MRFNNVDGSAYLQYFGDCSGACGPESVVPHHDDGVGDVTTEVRHRHDAKTLAHVQVRRAASRVVLRQVL